MNREHRPSKTLFLFSALALASVLTGCAHDPDKNKPWRKPEHKWYESDMNAEERSFFIGSFFDGH